MSRGPFLLPGANPRAQLRGAKANDAGDAFEAWLASQHQVARARGLAKVRKVSPEVKWVKGRGGLVTAKVVGENGCDYIGVVRPGRALVAEAKASDDPRLGRSAFERHQQDDLDAAVAIGSLSLALIQLRIDRRLRRFAAPWPLSWVAVGRGASVGIEELAPWEISEGECYLARWAR